MDVHSAIQECISTSDIDTLGRRLDEMELQVCASIPPEPTVAGNWREFESILTVYWYMQHPDAFEIDTWPHGLHLMAHIAARDLYADGV